MATKSLAVKKMAMFAARNFLLVKEAIVAYRKAIEGTTIYENAEDYALVILMNSYGAPFYLMILLPILKAADQRRANVNRMAGVAFGQQALHSYTAAQKKQRRRAGRHPPMRKKKPAKPKTCLTLLELARAFSNIAHQVCFHPKQSTFHLLMGRDPRSKQKVAQWL